VILYMKIVLGVYGDSLVDSVFMKPSEHSTVMEFFPSGVFTRDTEISSHSLGIRYIGWWNDQCALPLYVFSSQCAHLIFRQFQRDNLPPVTSGNDHDEELLIDATAVVQAIRQLATRT